MYFARLQDRRPHDFFLHTGGAHKVASRRLLYRDRRARPSSRDRGLWASTQPQTLRSAFIACPPSDMAQAKVGRAPRLDAIQSADGAEWPRPTNWFQRLQDHAYARSGDYGKRQ